VSKTAASAAQHRGATSRPDFKTAVARYALSLAAVGLVALAYRHVPVNPTTVALSFLLLVLLIASRWGLTISTTAAVAATLAFNYYFLPPLHTFVIADPQNWIALLAFLTSAIIASRLSERARREAMNANQRRREVERLYALSQQLLATDNVMELLNAIPASCSWTRSGNCASYRCASACVR
jgi:two-component system sensor histidine kinase KdpD